MIVTIEQELAKGFAKHREQTLQNFLKLTADHLISETDLEGGQENKENRIVLRTDHKLNDEVRAQVKDGFVIEDHVILRTARAGSIVLAPVYNNNKETEERTVLLVAVFETGAKIPKVGRVRVKTDKEGKLESMTLTDHKNERIGSAKIKQTLIYEPPTSGGSGGDPVIHARKISLYIDGFFYGVIDSEDIGYWVIGL